MGDRSGDEQALVASARRGDASAFADLVARYQGRVAGIAWRYGIPAAEIEDVVSEVLLKVYRTLPRYRPDHPFGTWLHRLAVNHVIDTTRRRRRERECAELPDQLADSSPGSSARLLQRERAAMLRDALAGLTRRHREVLALVYVEGLKVEETAAALGIPAGTVKTRLMRARQALRRILERDHPSYFGDEA